MPNDVFDVANQAKSTAKWLEEYKATITPSNAKKLETRLQRNKEKCPDMQYELIYFDGDKNISLFAKEVLDDDAEIRVSGVGFFGLSLKFSHVFESLHTLVFFFYSIKKFWESQIEDEQRERNRIKELSSEQIKEGQVFEGDFVVQDTWGNFVVSIKKKGDDELLSKRLCLINDKLYIEHDGKYLKLLTE